MGRISHLADAPVVVPDPVQEEGEPFILFGLGRVLVRLPRPRLAVRDAGIGARVQEDQLRARGAGRAERRRGEPGVAAFDDPAFVRGAEAREFRARLVRRTRQGDAVGQPIDGVEIERRKARRAGELPREGRFTRAGIAQNDNPQRSR